MSRWNFKAQYWGSMLLFKMARAPVKLCLQAYTASFAPVLRKGVMSQGKFYEIFEMDASVAAEFLDLAAMKAR